MSAGADVNVRNVYGFTSLAQLALRGNRMDTECADILLASGADVNLPVENGDMPVIICRKHDNSTLLQYLQEQGADLNRKNRNGRSALTIAIKYCKRMCIDIWISGGADVNVRNEYGCPVLITAASRGDFISMRALLTAGADENMRSLIEGTTALISCPGRSILCKETRKICVNLLIYNGADVNIFDEDGKTALMCAAAAVGNETVVRLLINAGADVNIADNQGRTALIEAASTPRVENEPMVKALIDAGADVNIADNWGRTALTEAAFEGNFQCMKLLLKEGAHVNKFSCRGNIVTYYLEHTTRIKKCIPKLLQAAGEEIGSSLGGKIPAYLKKHDGITLELKHICREAIRKHLLELNSHQNLFSRIPRLGLPSALVRYLLYYRSVDADDDDD